MTQARPKTEDTITVVSKPYISNLVNILSLQGAAQPVPNIFIYMIYVGINIYL
jgi:hypothetical protein